MTSELEDIFSQAPLAPNHVASARVLEAYAKATGKAPAVGSSKDSGRKLPGPGDDCAICYETMHGVAESALTFCATCGNALHNECFRQCGFFNVPFVILLADLGLVQGQRHLSLNLHVFIAVQHG